jgi:hypothetical protein
MSDERVIKLEVGCQPEAAISGGLLIQSENVAFFTFNAVSGKADEQGLPVGTAIMEFHTVEATQFGSPNDEGRPEHPLYWKGLKEIGHAVCEIVNSHWAKQIARSGEAGARRIWGSSYEQSYRQHDWTLRHFLVACHDATFECLAKSFTITLSHEPYSAILQRIGKSLGERG